MVALVSVPAPDNAGQEFGGSRPGACWSAWIIAARKRPRSGRRYSGCATRHICAKARSRPMPSERFADPLDEADNAWIFGVYIDGELASSIRLHVASRQSPDLPALNVFSDLLVPGDRRRQDHHRSDPLRRRPVRLAALSGAVLRDDAARLAGVGIFPAPTCCWPPCGPSIRPSTGDVSVTG